MVWKMDWDWIGKGKVACLKALPSAGLAARIFVS